MNRNWDKVRRQQRASKPLSQAQWRDQYPRKSPRRKRPNRNRRQFLSRATTPQPKPSKLPVLEKLLRVNTVPPCYARFERIGGRWRCVKADAEIEWMTRIRHVETVSDWLHHQRLSFTWLRSHNACTAPKPQAEDRPAEAYPPTKASVSSENNTVPSLNNVNQAEQRDDKPTASSCLERNDISNPRRLIRGGVPTTALASQSL